MTEVSVPALPRLAFANDPTVQMWADQLLRSLQIALDDLANNSVLTTKTSVTFSYNGTPTNGEQRLYSVGRTIDLATDLTGSVAYAGTVGTVGPAVFTLDYIRSGVTTSIGTMTFAIGSHTPVFSVGSAVRLLSGDVLLLTAPNPANATLANISFNLAASVS